MGRAKKPHALKILFCSRTLTKRALTRCEASFHCQYTNNSGYNQQVTASKTSFVFIVVLSSKHTQIWYCRSGNFHV